MERKRKRRLPGAAAALAAAALLLTTGASSGAAVSSPPAEAAEPALYKAVPAAGMDGMTAAGKGKAVPGAAAEPEGPPCPVPETEAVEDTYFERAIFLGDSRTQGLFLYSGLSSGYEYTAVGATVESVFTKKNYDLGNGEQVPLLDAMAGQACDKIYIMLGINELGWSKTETFHDQYAKLIDRVREDHPEAKIALQSIPPVSAKQDAKETYVNNARIRTYNGVIQALAEEEGCYFLDVAACLTGEGGVLPVEQTTDGVHFNTAGCRTWLGYLRTHSLEAGPAAAREAAERPPDAPARPEGRSVGPA
ncbi:GDSL-type esterase/lipase family protein [uncultured Oscillibacter sp.]|uniref:GDSL-type esterase/lipase family protein n=1 Tax=uncultured Oscillibacter sp. TaxID=876091 RepID=UPI0025FD95CD|nr:GDSL-type esterase/lipase family protein [uncultured Oscillibacter sp.]